LAYIEPAYRLKQSDNITELYANTLAAMNRNSEALLLLEKMVKQGRASAKNEEKLKQLFVLVHGSEQSFGKYVATLHDSMAVYVKEKAVKAMISRPAPLFTLKDLKGNTVSLEALKGKVVVVDFWATWCGPCKKSFPAMQLAVNKYEQDTAVRFLFIDTWERIPDAAAAVSSFIQSNKYSFQVLLDGKDTETNTNKVVTGYGVKMIPAKFVIDPQGNIRFELTGFDGSNESAVAELSAMIDLAKHS
jgi:thiol-disulfide isomerase/thioredoxin